MSSVLITVEKILNYSGSELVVLDLVRYLVSKGNIVTVATSYVHPRFDGLFSEVGISLININPITKPFVNHFDIIWAHHYSILDICLLDLEITSDRILFSSLSPYVPEECPPSYASDLTLILANSPENKDHLESYGFTDNFVHVFPNPVSDSEFALESPYSNNQVKKVGIVTNHLCSELNGVADILQDREGVIVHIYGIDHNFCLVTSDLLLQYDVIVTVGRTVQHCIVLGIPVYCYDHFGGPGYLSSDNLERASYFNYSGRCSGKKSVNEISAELLDNYDQALSDIHIISASTRDRYLLSRHVDYVLAEINKAPKLNFETMGSFQQALRRRKGHQNRPYTYSNCSAELYWLEGTDKNYSEQRKLSLRYCLDQSDIVLRFVFPEKVSNVCALRLDISDKPNSFSINEIYLEDADGAIIWVWDKATNIFDDLSSHIVRISSDSNSESIQFAAVGNDPYFKINLDSEVLSKISSNVRLVVSFKASDLTKVVIRLKEELDSLSISMQRQPQIDHLWVDGTTPSPSRRLISDLEDITTLITQALLRRDRALVSKTSHLNLMREELSRAEAQLDLLKDVLINNLDEASL